MIYAIVKSGVVVNIAVSSHPLSQAWIDTEGLSVQIGDTYDGTSFFHDGDKVLTEEERLLIENADMKEALELLGVNA